MAYRFLILAMIALSRGAHWMLEQPGSSRLIHLPGFRNLTSMLKPRHYFVRWFSPKCLARFDILNFSLNLLHTINQMSSQVDGASGRVVSKAFTLIGLSVLTSRFFQQVFHICLLIPFSHRPTF